MALCGCASDEAASRFLVQPDRYFLYNCEALATAAQANAVRQRELEALMTKAGVDTGGRLVSSRRKVGTFFRSGTYRWNPPQQWP
jgi:hypothetical protein